MRILIDTNVLGRLSQPRHPMHHGAIQSVKRLRDEAHELRIVPQVIYEYWTVATRPADQNGLGLAVAEAHSMLDDFKSVFPPLRDERGILERWEALVDSHAVKGKPTHDARLIAAMQRHGLTHLLTFNVADFARYQFVQILDPLKIASA